MVEWCTRCFRWDSMDGERVKGVRVKGISANLCRSVAEEKVKGVRVKGKKRATRRCLDTSRRAGLLGNRRSFSFFLFPFSFPPCHHEVVGIPSGLNGYSVLLRWAPVAGLVKGKRVKGMCAPRGQFVFPMPIADTAPLTRSHFGNIYRENC